MKGFDEYFEKLVKAGRDIDAAADRANVAAGDVILEGMEELVPRDTENLAEHLERSEPEVDGNYHSVNVGMQKTPKPDADTARYGNVQEYGSARTPAQSYIRAGFDRKRSNARKAQKESLKKDGAL
jgi:HK97 gp10 family phage protein